MRGASQSYIAFPDSLVLALKGSENDRFIPPVIGRILSPFGYRGRRLHSGVDISLHEGDTVRCAFDGVVRVARHYFGYGNCVVVRHTNGLETLYGHLSGIKVKANDTLRAGDMLGLGGHTGRASCSHLHFETFFQGRVFNPKNIIDFDSYCLLRDKLRISSRLFRKIKDYQFAFPGSDPDSQISAASENAVSDTSPGQNTINSSRFPANRTHIQNAKTKGKVHKDSSHRYHSIKSGQTLSAIAVKNRTTVKQICSLNGIRSGKILKSGTRIRTR